MQSNTLERKPVNNSLEFTRTNYIHFNSNKLEYSESFVIFKRNFLQGIINRESRERMNREIDRQKEWEECVEYIPCHREQRHVQCHPWTAWKLHGMLIYSGNFPSLEAIYKKRRKKKERKREEDNGKRKTKMKKS